MAFDYPTNFTLVNNVSGGVDGIGSLFEYAGHVTGGMFGIGLIGMIFIMVFSISAMLNMGRAFASASFVAFAFSIYFVRINAVTPVIPFILMVMVIAGILWAKSERTSY